MRVSISVECVCSWLRLIGWLLPLWETDQELKETADTSSRGGTPAPDALPFGLDKTLDTPEHTRTYAGACHLLTTLVCEWEACVDAPHRGGQELVGRLLALAPSVYARAESTRWDAYAEILERLARDAIRHTGRQPKTTSYPCLTCGVLLEQPYTDEGLLDMYVCPACDAYYTPSTYMQTAKAYALYVKPDCVVTREQAAYLLDVSPETLTVRIHRYRVKPVSGRGHHQCYRLSDLLPATQSKPAHSRERSRVSSRP